MTDNNDLWEVDRGDYVNIIASLRAELKQERYQRAQAQSHAASLGNTVQRHYDVVAEMAAELSRLRAALARAERDVRGLRNDRDVWRDAADEAADVSEELERSRRTIRALVVVARAMWRIVRNDPELQMGELRCWLTAVHVHVEDIRFEESQAARQAGKE